MIPLRPSLGVLFGSPQQLAARFKTLVRFDKIAQIYTIEPVWANTLKPDANRFSIDYTTGELGMSSDFETTLANVSNYRRFDLAALKTDTYTIYYDFNFMARADDNNYDRASIESSLTMSGWNGSGNYKSAFGYFKACGLQLNGFTPDDPRTG